MLDRTSPPSPQLPTPRFWSAFEDFPVTLHGKPPTKEEAAGAGFEDRRYYHYRRRLQYKLRVQYTLEQSTDRTGKKPPASRVRRTIANVPTVDSVLMACVHRHTCFSLRARMANLSALMHRNSPVTVTLT